MSQDKYVKFDREQLYNEIWDIAVSGVSKKYSLPYTALMKSCKDAQIPIPPSGYWMQLRFGKPVTQTPLPVSIKSEVMVPIQLKSEKPRSSTDNVSADKEDNKTVQVKDDDRDFEQVITEDKTEITSNENTQYRKVLGTQNTYNREKLYEEVWSKPVVSVALLYGVSDVAIHKVCKSLNIPVPPRGYWAKLRAGQKVKKTPLPASKGIIEITGTRTFEGIKDSNLMEQALSFLSEEERQKVIIAAQQISMPDENAKLHKRLLSYKHVVEKWNKDNEKPEGSQKNLSSYSNKPPFLAGVISSNTLGRVYRILHALFYQIETLGGSVNEDLSLQIRNEHVTFEISESQDEIKHTLTKLEAREMLVYEDAMRHHSWASKPKIRKYDYVFNGRLRLTINKDKYFKDTNKDILESRLGDILIELYEQSEIVRINRVAREEAVRKREEEERLREERRNLYNNEVTKTKALENAAQDYDTACRIRAYIATFETPNNGNGDNTAYMIMESPSPALAKKLSELEQEKERLNESYQELCKNANIKELNEEEITKMFRLARNQLEVGTLKMTKVLVETFIDKVIVYKDRVEVVFNFCKDISITQEIEDLVDSIKQSERYENTSDRGQSAILCDGGNTPLASTNYLMKNHHIWWFFCVNRHYI